MVDLIILVVIIELANCQIGRSGTDEIVDRLIKRTRTIGQKDGDASAAGISNDKIF